MNKNGKQIMKKGMAVLLTSAMVLGFTACGDSSTGIDTSVTEFEIFAGVSATSPDNGDKTIVQQMNDAMGIEVEWTCVAGDALTEKKNLILNTGTDLPDAIMGAGLTQVVRMEHLLH